MVFIDLIKNLISMKNLTNSSSFIIIQILTVVCCFILRIDCASSSLVYVRDINMGGYQVGFTFNSGSGVGNSSSTFPHAPDINPTSINYKLLISTSYNADYTISSNTISISVQVSAKNQTHLQASLYSSYVESFSGVYIWIDVLIIDEASSSYTYILPSILILNGLTLMSTSYEQFVDVSTFSPSNLNLSNNLIIYSFLIGFQIVSQNNNFQLTVSSQIINETKIKVTISSLVNLISVDLVKIDTIVIDKTAITFSKLLVLDFQTADCPTNPYTINYAYPSYSNNNENKFTGLSSFYLINQAHYAFSLTANPTNIVITVFAAYNFTRIVFTNLFFVMKQCPVGFPFFDKPSQLCFTFSCSSNYYLDVSSQQCLPCLYSCQTCQNGINCTSCNSSDFRILDANNSMCVPIDGYYDDGTNISVSQQCNSPCANCFGDADNCTSCMSSAYDLDNVLMNCIHCLSKLSKCLSCVDSVTCTQMCLYFCETCDNNVNCTSCNSSVDFRVLDLNTSLCIPIDGYFDDGTNNSVAQKCNSPCVNCIYDADNCTSCINSAYYLELNSSTCILCQYFNLGCLVCERQGSQILCLNCDLNSSFIMTNNSLCACSNNSFYHNSTSNCQICQDFLSECLECSSQVRCTECSPYFNLYNSTNTTICQQICGDGVLFNLECDDGNLINGDGCSSSCQIELFFSCSGGSSTSQSVCVYNGNIEITTISFLKDETKNTVYLRFQVNKNINISSINLNLMFLPNFPYQTIQTIYDASVDQYLCTINYDKPLNSYDRLTLTFRFPTDSSFSSSLNFTITLNSQTDNNLALKVYSPQMYSQLKDLTYSSEILIFFYIAVCLVAWIAGEQLYSLQLFFVLQYAYLGLLTIDRLEFSLISLKQFALSFGVCDFNNLIKESNEFLISSNNPLPIKIKSLGFSESLLLNINLSFAILLSMFLVGLLIYFIGVLLELLRWQIQGKKMFVWWVFYWSIIIQIPALTNICISFKYQKQSFQNFRADFLISFLYLILFACIIIYLLIFKNASQSIKIINLNNQSLQEISSPNTQNKYSFEEKNYTSAKLIETYFSLLTQEQIQNDQLSCFLKNKFYLCLMIYRALIVLTVIFSNDYISDYVGSNVLCLILDLLILLYISIVRPYKFNFRPIFNSSIILVLEVFYTYKKIVNKQSDVSLFSFDVVVIIIALLYLTLIINIYFIADKIIQNFVNYFQVQQKRKIDVNQTNKVNQNLQDQINYQREMKNQTKDFINFQQKQQQNYFEKLQFQFEGQVENVHQKPSRKYSKKVEKQIDQIIMNKKNDQSNIRTIKIQPKSNISQNLQQTQGFENKNTYESNIHNSDINSQDFFLKQQKIIFASSIKDQEVQIKAPFQQLKTSRKRRKHKKTDISQKNQQQQIKENEETHIFYI